MNMPLHTSMFTYSLTHTCSYIHLNLHFNNMHTYLYIYIYIYLYAHAFTDINFFAHLLTHKCTKTHVQSINSHSWTYMISLHIHADTGTWSQIYTHTVICTQTWRYLHMQTVNLLINSQVPSLTQSCTCIWSTFTHTHTLMCWLRNRCTH